MMGRKVKFNMSNVVSDGWCRLQAAGAPRCHREKVEIVIATPEAVRQAGRDYPEATNLALCFCISHLFSIKVDIRQVSQ